MLNRWILLDYFDWDYFDWDVFDWEWKRATKLGIV
jgi:hypothetical protein